MRGCAFVYLIFLVSVVFYSMHLTSSGAWLDGPDNEPSLRNGSLHGARGHHRSRSFYGK